MRGTLYQQQFEEIVEKRGHELQKVMAESMAQGLAKAYAMAGHQLDETALHEITTQVTSLARWNSQVCVALQIVWWTKTFPIEQLWFKL
jgi:hypothetical protein